MTIDIERQEGPVGDDVAALLRMVYVGEGHAEAAAADLALTPSALRERGTLWLARSNGSLAGVVLLVEPTSRYRQIAVEGELEAHLLAVAPEYRRAGVAEALLRTLVSECQKRGAQHLVLSTQPTMHAAWALYLKLGFQRQPERDWQRPNGRTYHAFALKLTE